MMWLALISFTPSGYKRMIAIGSLGTFISLVISAVASHSLPCLFLFNGFTLGVSHGLAMPCYLSFSAQHFARRRGLATGIVASGELTFLSLSANAAHRRTFAGAGIGGGTASLIMRGLLPKVGYRNTVLIYAGMNAVITIVGWFIMTPRLQPLKDGQRRYPKQWLPRGIWRRGTWWSWLMAIAVGIFGYLVSLSSPGSSAVLGLEKSSSALPKKGLHEAGGNQIGLPNSQITLSS